MWHHPAGRLIPSPGERAGWERTRAASALCAEVSYTWIPVIDLHTGGNKVTRRAAEFQRRPGTRPPDFFRSSDLGLRTYLYYECKCQSRFYWCASCGSCENHRRSRGGILGVVKPSISSSGPWPWTSRRTSKRPRTVRRDVSQRRDSRGQEEMAHLLRRKSQFLIAYGACTHLGSIPNGNQYGTNSQYVYEDGPAW